VCSEMKKLNTSSFVQAELLVAKAKEGFESMIGVRIGMLGRVIKELGSKIDETGLKNKRVLQEGFQVAIEES
jgi:hypothetical protein